MKSFNSKFALTAVSGAMMLMWGGASAEDISWKDVPGLSFLQTDNTGGVFLNSSTIWVHPNEGVHSLNLRVKEDELSGSYYLSYSATSTSPDRNLNIKLENRTLTLGGTISIDSWHATKGYKRRDLNVTGETSSKLVLTGSDFGMRLGGDLKGSFDGVEDISIIHENRDQSASHGIIMLSQLSWPSASEPSSSLIVQNNKSFTVKGNVNHAIASYGNNLIDISSEDISLDVTVSGNAYKNSLFNTLITGSGKIYLTANNSVSLIGVSGSTSLERDQLFSESYAIRGAEIVCDACSSSTRTTRNFDADFRLKSKDTLTIDTNWGAVFMEAIEDSNKAFYAQTLLEAPKIKVIASGTSEDQKTNATFKAVSNVDAQALISLKATEDITVDYRDTLGKEKKQDLFYADGEQARIELEAPYIELNNNYDEKRGNSADLRNVFYANAKANISLKGKTNIVGNTSARDQGAVSLELAPNSVITGAMFDNSYPYYDLTTESIGRFKDSGYISLKGSVSSVWNVLPYIDSVDRGEIFGKNTIRSTVNSISAEGSVRDNPFIVNLTGSTVPNFSGRNNSIPYQSLNVTNLLDTGFVQFSLRFDDKNGTNSGRPNGRDTVLIHNGSGSHGIYVQYRGNSESVEENSLRQAWLIADDSQKASFELLNSDQAVDIGVYRYELASEVGDSPMGGNQEAKFWYLKRKSDSSGDNPFTPAADTGLSFAGSQRYLHWTDLQDLRKRLGEVRYGSQDGAWVRGIIQKDLADGQSGSSGLKQTYQGLNIGLDRLVSVAEERMWLLGANLNLGHAEQKTRGNDYGKGETDRYGLNLYATWASDNGNYADFVASVDYYDQEVNTRANDVAQKGDYDTFGLGASIEIGKQFTSESDDYTWGPWYRHTWIEPQLQLAYYWLKGKKYKLSNRGIRVNIKDDDSLIGRAGVVLGSKWNYGENYNALNKKYFQAYVKAGVKHDFMGDYKVTMNDQVFSKDIGATTFYYGAGFDWQAGDSTRIYVQFEREEGDNYVKEYEVSAGLKYQF